MNKFFPDVKVVITNGALVPFQVQAPLIVNDVMSATLLAGQGDSVGMSFAAQNPNAGGEWNAQTSYLSIEGLEFARFCEDGTVKFGAKSVEAGGRDDWAGWIIRPRMVWLDAKVDDGNDTDATDQKFVSVKGIWNTVSQTDAKRGTGIYATKSGAQGNSKVRTIGTIPRNRQLCFALRFTGQESREGQFDARVSFGGVGDGDRYSLYFSQGQTIGLERYVAADNGATVARSHWQREFSFDSLPPANLQGGEYIINVLRLSGRIVVTINGSSFWNLVLEEGASASGSQGSTTTEKRVLDVNWGKGKIEFETNNVKCRFEMGVIKYSEAGGTPYTGSFVRSITRNGGVPDSAFEAYTGGWKKDGATIRITSDDSSYTALLRANTDGIDTPFLSKVTLFKEGEYTEPTAFQLDITSAVSSIRVNQQLPTQDARTGSRADLEIDMVALRELCRINNIPSLAYATSYRRLDISARWLDSTGTPDGAYVPIFRGLTTQFSESLAGFANHTRSLHAEDYLVLLDKPAAFIDQRYPPLDLFFCRKSGEALSNINQTPDSGGAVMYGYECVREIIRTELGSAIADDMQVFLPPTHYPLVDSRRDHCGYLTLESAFAGSSPFNNGFMFPPPFGECALDWIRKFQELDRAVFFMSFPEDDRTQPPKLTYARLQFWLQQSGRVTWSAPDNLYSAGDIDRVIESLELETRADRDYNHIAAWSSQQGVNLGGLYPAMRISEAYTRVGRSRAPLSWRRTLLIQNSLGWVGSAGVAGVDALAQGVRNEIEGISLIWPSATMPGNAYMAPGDKLVITRQVGGLVHGPRGKGEPASLNYSSPAGYDGAVTMTCRIESLEHTITLEADPMARRWTTRPGVRPLLNSEIPATIGAGAAGTSGDGARID